MFIVIPGGLWEQIALNGCIRRKCTDIKNRSDVLTVNDSAKQVGRMPVCAASLHSSIRNLNTSKHF
jgi:hypothetical protein